MILSDIDIKAAIVEGRIKIDPLPSPGDIQAASLDVHLGNHFFVLKDAPPFWQCISTHTDNSDCFYEATTNQNIVIPPHGLVLAGVSENLTLSNDLACQVGGKSSLGRLGLQVHATAGWVDPGWSGYLTLELTNLTDWPIRVYVGDKIAQLIFMQLFSPARKTYNGKYQNAEKTQISRSYLDHTGVNGEY